MRVLITLTPVEQLLELVFILRLARKRRGISSCVTESVANDSVTTPRYLSFARCLNRRVKRPSNKRSSGQTTVSIVRNLGLTMTIPVAIRPLGPPPIKSFQASQFLANTSSNRLSKQKIKRDRRALGGRHWATSCEKRYGRSVRFWPRVCKNASPKLKWAYLR